MSNEKMGTVSYVETLDISPAIRIENSTPSAYRLGRRSGELVIQGAYQWQQGLKYGHEWRDIPTVDLDAEPAK